MTPSGCSKESSLGLVHPHLRPGALTICRMENPEISGRIQMERFIPMEISGKKVIPFDVLPFFCFYRNDRNSLYHLFGLINSSDRLHVEKK